MIGLWMINHKSVMLPAEYLRRQIYSDCIQCWWMLLIGQREAFPTA